MKKTLCPAALVTGGSRRIGRAVALGFADDGYDVALHYNFSAKDARDTALCIRKKGRKCVLFQAALEDQDAPQNLVCEARKAFSGLQVLVHSASLFQPSGFDDNALHLLDVHWDIHVRAAWSLGAAFSRYVKKGSIIHFLDTKITRDKTEYGAYLLSKKALAELVRMSAAAFAPAIRVNAVAPGFILPPEGKDKKCLARIADIPLKRKGTTANVTDAVRFLVHNDYITGQVIFVDGGEHLI